MATNEQVERAINYMRDNSLKLASAKATRVYLEQFRKSKKAMLMQEAPITAKTVSDKENYAYSHDDYLELLDGLKVAVEIEEEYKYKFKCAELRFEQWRTEQANNRAERSRYDSA